jgi:uncharacterized protein
MSAAASCWRSYCIARSFDGLIADGARARPGLFTALLIALRWYRHMSRILFWIILFGAGYWFWRRAKQALLRAAAEHAKRMADGMAGGMAPGTGRAGPVAGSPRLAEPMVRCAYCGAHSPTSETVGLYRRHFCNAEHAERYAKGERATEGR